MSNPHYDAALERLDPDGEFHWEGDLANISARLEAQAQATLALAHEQRTANLINYVWAKTTDTKALSEEIETRLGLGDTK